MKRPRPQARASSWLALALLAPGLASADGMLSALAEGALARDPVLAAAEAQSRATAERTVQARAGFGPSASFTHTYTENRYRELDRELRPFFNRQNAIQVTQPVWRAGLQPTLQGAQALERQADAALGQVRGEALLRLADAVFELLKARDALESFRAAEAAAQERVAASRRALAVGALALPELRDAEARAASAAGQRMAAEAERQFRIEALAEIAGQAPPQLLERVPAPEGAMPAAPTSALLEDLLARALADNPAVRQAEHALEVAEAEVRRAWMAHAPSVDLNLSLGRSADSGTLITTQPRRGELSAVGVNLTIPLFASGATQSRVREAQALRDRARADLEGARRAALVAVRQQHLALRVAVEQWRAARAVVQALEEDRASQQRAVRIGLRAPLESLESEARLAGGQREERRAVYEAWLAQLRLRAASGELGGAALAAVDAAFVPGAGPAPKPPPAPLPPAR